jgi:N-acyl-D-amino-acid deacylase
VIVDGQLVLKDGKQTDELPGRVLQGPNYRAETAPHAVSTGKLDARLDSFDRMMRAFMERHHVPGASLAVTDQGRVVLARGYGYADVATGEQVTADSLFRIASLSKPITAVAILQLVERGKLRLDDKVFEVLDREGDIQTIGARFDTRQRDITIRHLLEHRGGWDRDVSFDGMFRSVEFAVTRGLPAPAGPETVIRSMLEHSLDFDPGHRYAYSNYGYCLLGRVVEKLAGQSYEQYVQANVLAPLDIHAMRIGKTRLEQRQPNEVRYYYPGRGPSVFQEDLGKQVPWPYGGWYLEAMDSHGAWIASATDLAKFAAAFDDPEHCKILSAASIATMFARPAGLAGHEEDGTEKAVFYSLGWFNRVVGEGQQNNWHTGSLAGTATILIRRHDGRNFVALFNARGSSDAAHFGREIDPQLHQAADEVSEWPK